MSRTGGAGSGTVSTSASGCSSQASSFEADRRRVSTNPTARSARTPGMANHHGDHPTALPGGGDGGVEAGVRDGATTEGEGSRGAVADGGKACGAGAALSGFGEGVGLATWRDVAASEGVARAAGGGGASIVGTAVGDAGLAVPGAVGLTTGFCASTGPCVVGVELPGCEGCRLQPPTDCACAAGAITASAAINAAPDAQPVLLSPLMIDRPRPSPL